MRSATPTNIAILSSDAVLCASLTSLFEARGHCLTVDRGVDGSAVVEAACVVVDLDRPPHQLTLGWIESRYPQVPCVVLSGSPWSGPYAATGLSHGYFLHKPVPALGLAAMVEGVLHDQSLG